MRPITAPSIRSAPAAGTVTSRPPEVIASVSRTRRSSGTDADQVVKASACSRFRRLPPAIASPPAARSSSPRSPGRAAAIDRRRQRRSPRSDLLQVPEQAEAGESVAALAPRFAGLPGPAVVEPAHHRDRRRDQVRMRRGLVPRASRRQPGAERLGEDEDVAGQVAGARPWLRSLVDEPLTRTTIATRSSSRRSADDERSAVAAHADAAAGSATWRRMLHGAIAPRAERESLSYHMWTRASLVTSSAGRSHRSRSVTCASTRFLRRLAEVLGVGVDEVVVLMPCVGAKPWRPFQTAATPALRDHEQVHRGKRVEDAATAGSAEDPPGPAPGGRARSARRSASRDAPCARRYPAGMEPEPRWDSRGAARRPGSSAGSCRRVRAPRRAPWRAPSTAGDVGGAGRARRAPRGAARAATARRRRTCVARARGAAASRRCGACSTRPA